MTCDWFNPQGSKANTTKKDYKPIPLNAVVVKEWDNQVPPPDKQIVFMTMAMKALTTAFLKWQQDQLKLEALRKPSTYQMCRRKLKVLNRNKLIFFADDYFGIFPSHEVCMLANVPVRDTEKELNIARDQVYAKYNAPMGDKKI